MKNHTAKIRLFFKKPTIISLISVIYFAKNLKKHKISLQTHLFFASWYINRQLRFYNNNNAPVLQPHSYMFLYHVGIRGYIRNRYNSRVRISGG